jgi:zinc finger MYM-type protein 2/3/4
MEEHTDPPIEATPELEADAEAVVEQQPAEETVEPTEPAVAEAEEKADEPEEPTVAEEEQTDGTMEVDEPPNEDESQATDEPASDAVAPDDDTPVAAEPAQPEEAEEPAEEPVDESEPPHAMEVSDFNENEHDHDAVARASEAETNALMDTEDHDKTANDTEKSMEAVPMNESVSDDPFDSLRHTTDAEKSGEQAKSTANSERDPDETGDDIEDNGHDDGEEAGDETAETENQTTDDVDQPDDATDDVTEEHEGVDEDLCLLPDEEREITEAEKEQAILAIEESEKAPEETEVAEAEAGAEDPEKDDDVIEVAPEPPADEEPAAPLTEAGVDAAAEPASGETPASEAPPAAEGEETPPAAATVVAPPAPQPHVGEKVSIWQIIDTTKACQVCKDEKLCKYRYKEDTDAEFNYICDTKCIERHAAPTPGKFLIKRKKYVIQESVGDDQQAVHFCVQCSDDKKCKYYFEQQEENFYVCDEDCLNLLLSEHTDRLRKRTVRVRNLAANKPSSADADASKIVARSEEEAEALRQERESSFIRRCMQCFNLISISARTIQWETMDFCNEKCLGSYQNVVGANCTTCCMTVPLASLGKYCVRFGFDIRQFCSSSCLDTFKKKLRVCSYCQNDIPGKAGMLAPVGDKGQFKDFCTKLCLKKYEELVGHKKKTGSHVCSVCNLDQPVKVTIVLDMKEHNFCSQPCFSAFKFVNNVNPGEIIE